MPVPVSAAPRARISAAAGTYGEQVVVGWCTALVRASAPDAVPREAALVLGGRHAVILLDDPTVDHAWWWRVWGLRGLLYVWDDRAGGDVLTVLGDEAWRVREAALRVVARRRIDGDPQHVADLAATDPVPRVRAAAGRALIRFSAR